MKTLAIFWQLSLGGARTHISVPMLKENVLVDLKADLTLKTIPVIVVTSYALSGDEEKAYAAGCDAYIAKPYDPLALLETIRQHLG